jgi:4-hydroxy-4-methyl-2-oxoglutarate aldolase
MVLICTGKDDPMSASHSPRDDLSVLSRLERLDASTMSDADKALRVLPAAIRPVSACSRLLGRAVTANARDDLLSVLGALRRGGPGDVLVVAAGGSQQAVAGELFAGEAARRGMAGIVIDGFCRDTATLKRMTIPVYARGATPRAAGAMVVPEVNVPVLLGTVTVHPGDILLGDDDGIVVATEAEMAAAIDKAEAIQLTEDALLSAMAEGVSLFDKLNFDEHVNNVRAGKASSLSFDA